MQGTASAAALKDRENCNNDRDVFLTEMLDNFSEAESSSESNTADRSKKMVDHGGQAR